MNRVPPDKGNPEESDEEEEESEEEEEQEPDEEVEVSDAAEQGDYRDEAASTVLISAIGFLRDDEGCSACSGIGIISHMSDDVCPVCRGDPAGFAEAPESLLKRLSSMRDLKDIVAAAIKSTPGIEAVCKKRIQVVDFEVVLPEAGSIAKKPKQAVFESDDEAGNEIGLKEYAPKEPQKTLVSPISRSSLKWRKQEEKRAEPTMGKMDSYQVQKGTLSRVEADRARRRKDVARKREEAALRRKETEYSDLQESIATPLRSRPKQDDGQRRKADKAAVESDEETRSAASDEEYEDEEEERQAAALKIQTIQRQRMAKKEVEQRARNKEREQAAVKIQKQARARQQRLQKAQEEKDRRRYEAAVKIQARERRRQAMKRAEQLRIEKEQEILRDIALMSNTGLTSDLEKRKALGQAKGWNRSGRRLDGTDATLRDRDSFSSPYGSGLDWGTIGYRIPSASSSAMKTGLKVKEKRVPGKPLCDRTALANFKVDMLRREQSLSAAWRTFLDPDWQGKLAIHEFCNACRKMGYYGNVRDIWKDMDVDGNGLVSLAELDWEEAHELGEFHRKLVKVYGSATEAARHWGMQGPRRFKIDEFYDHVIRGGFVEGAIAADRLFRMMCDVPVEGECCGHLGHLKDEATSVTVREMKWLDAIGPGLPHVTRDRVQPGDLGYVHEEEEKATLRKIRHDHDVDKFFEHMYKDAVEHHKRKKELMEPEPSETRVISDPNLFSRLHKDHVEKMQRREQLKKDIDDKAWKEANWRVGTERDPKVRERIYAPRRQFAEFNFDCVAKKEHLWNLLTIHQLTYEADKLVEEIRKEDPHFEWKSLGKTRNELIEFCYRYTPEAPREINPNAPVPEAIEKLHEDAEERKERLEKKQREAMKQEDEEFKRTLICPHHGPQLSHPTCGTCRRFLAIKTGERQPKTEEGQEGDGQDKIWSASEDFVKKKRMHQETLFKQLLDDGYHKGLVANREYESARIALEDAYSKDDRRWDYCVGRDRERLIKEAIQYYNQRVKEDDERKAAIKDKHFEDHGAAFYRLHISGIQTRAKSEDERRRKADAAQAELDLLNVHRHARARSSSLFEGLHVNHYRSDEEDLDHANYRLMRKRARDRSVERIKLNERREAALRTIKASASASSRMVDLHSKPGQTYEKVLGLYFESIEDPRQLPSRFEVALRIRLDELGVPDVSHMPCRYRPLDGGTGLIIELKGSADQTSAAVEAVTNAEEAAKKVAEGAPIPSKAVIEVCKQKCTKVWEFDSEDDPNGEFYDFLMFIDKDKDKSIGGDSGESVEDRVLTNVWKNHFAVGGKDVVKDKFLLKVKQLGFTGDAVHVWHALIDPNGDSPRSLVKDKFLENVKRLRQPAKMHAWTGPPSDNLVAFSEALRRVYSSAKEAFRDFNRSGDGKLTPTEFMQALKKLQKDRGWNWNGNFPALFQELDIRNVGHLRPQEFSRLGDREVTDRLSEHEHRHRTDSSSRSSMIPQGRNRGASLRSQIANPMADTQRKVADVRVEASRKGREAEPRQSVAVSAHDKTLKKQNSETIKDPDEHHREKADGQHRGAQRSTTTPRAKAHTSEKAHISEKKLFELEREARKSLRPPMHDAKDVTGPKTPKKRYDEGAEPESEPEKLTRSPTTSVARKTLNLSGSLKERASLYSQSPLLSAGGQSARVRASRSAPVKQHQAR